MGTDVMKVAIVGGSLDDYDVLDKKMNELIEESQIYLFYVLCGGLANQPHQPSLGEVWAEKNGAPIKYIYADSAQDLESRLTAAAAYIVFLLRDEQWIKNLMMKYKATGKHGTVIKF